MLYFLNFAFFFPLRVTHRILASFISARVVLPRYPQHNTTVPTSGPLPWLLGTFYPSLSLFSLLPGDCHMGPAVRRAGPHWLILGRRGEGGRGRVREGRDRQGPLLTDCSARMSRLSA